MSKVLPVKKGFGLSSDVNCGSRKSIKTRRLLDLWGRKGEGSFLSPILNGSELFRVFPSLERHFPE